MLTLRFDISWVYFSIFTSFELLADCVYNFLLSLLVMNSPLRRQGISKFYCGKSKSFTSLGDAIPSSSAMDLSKPENSYSRKRKNLLGFNMWGKPSNRSQRSNGDIAVSKRPANSSRTTQGLGPSTSSSSESNSYSNGSREPQQPPPVNLHNKAIAWISSFAPTQWLSCPTRSFSLADLEGTVSSSPSTKCGDKQRRFH